MGYLCYFQSELQSIWSHPRPVAGICREYGGADLFDPSPKEVEEQFAQPHNQTRLVGNSGGKDGALAARLVVEHLLSIPRSDRSRIVHVEGDETLAKCPLIIGHIRKRLVELSNDSVASGHLIVDATTTHDQSQVFVLILIGRSYPSANRFSSGARTGRIFDPGTTTLAANQVFRGK